MKAFDVHWYEWGKDSEFLHLKEKLIRNGPD